MDIKNISFNNLLMLAGSDCVLLIAAALYYDYVDNVRATTPSGVRYTCLMPEVGYQQISIKVEGEIPTISQEDIEAAKPQLLVVGFGDFLAKFYTDRTTNKPQISAKAGAIYRAGVAQLVIKEDKKA